MKRITPKEAQNYIPLTEDYTNHEPSYFTLIPERNGWEKVVYYTYDQTQVGGLTTNAQYYVNTNVGVNTITLHKNEGDAIVGINTITLTSNGIGKQSFASVNKKSVVSSFNIISAWEIPISQMCASKPAIKSFVCDFVLPQKEHRISFSLILN